jgi:isoquinoline 1-oxidoreductase beta subunit
MKEICKVSRRRFLKICPTAGAGLVLGCYLPPLGKSAAAQTASTAAFTPNAFIRIDTSGQVTIWAAKSEMGQGVRTALPMIVAEELDADWTRVRIEQADLDRKYGSQLTGGSLSVRTSWDPLRKAGAAGRTMLIAAAAQQWGVEPDSCRAEQGFVIHTASNRRLSYGELAAAAAKLPVPAEVKLKDAKEFRLVGTPVKRTDTPMKVDGSGIFGLDVRVPGMLYAVIERCPIFGGELESFDAAKAKAVPGVRQVVEIKRAELTHPFTNRVAGAGHQHYMPGGVAVIANSTWAAMEGRRALTVKWKEGEHAQLSSASLRETFEKLAQIPGKVLRNEGDVEQALAQAAKKIEAVYELPFLAHAPMEPVNCTAHTTDNGCEVWGPTQIPGAAQAAIAHALKLPLDSIKVHVTLLGGGFGRRLNQDYTVEAALVSRAAGTPVQVVWTREDEIQRDYYRPASYHKLAAALDAQGNPTAWLHRHVSPSIDAFYQGTGIPNPESSEINPQDFPAITIPNARVEYALANTVVPRGWWRAVESSVNPFVMQSFLDEIAAAGGHDPVALRLKLLASPRRVGNFDTGRLRRVIELAASKGDWGKPLPKGRGRGIAAHFCFRSYVAQVAEVAVAADGKVRVERVVCAVDCGTAINPDIVKAQMEGGIAFGLSAVLRSAITLKDGRVEQSNFHDYQVLRINEMPMVEVHIVPSQEAPGGIGEPGVAPLAAAVGNAIFAATGKRVRRLPVRAQDLRA